MNAFVVNFKDSIPETIDDQYCANFLLNRVNNEGIIPGTIKKSELDREIQNS